MLQTDPEAYICSVVAHVLKLNQTVNRTQNTPPDENARMRQKVASLHTHFREAALFNHIRLLLTGGFTKSDLPCATFSTKRNF